MSGQLLWHGFGKRWIDNRHIWGDVKVGQWVLYAFVVIGDDRECSDLGSGAGGGRNRTESGFCAQLREVEWDAQLLEGGVRVFIEGPHRFGRVDRRAAANRYDPVWLELAHLFGALHDRLYRRVCFDTLKYANFHASLFEVVTYLVQKSKALHAAAADYDDGAFSVEGFQRFQCALAVIQVSW